jgi:hypothetical protein
MKCVTVVIILMLFATSALAGKPKTDPAECPCFDLMIELAAQTECTTFVNSIRVGKGKRNTIKRVLWLDSDPTLETDEHTDTDTDTCYLVDVNTPEARVDAYSGFPNGGSTCFYATGVPDRPDPPRCRLTDLSGSELKACFSTLENVKSDVKDLPECPPGAIPWLKAKVKSPVDIDALPAGRYRLVE